MKIYRKINILWLITFVVVFAACNTASKDVEPIVPPNDSYPVIESLTLDNTGTITEGDEVTYTLKMNKPIERSLTFSTIVSSSSTATEGSEFTISDVTIPAYYTEGKITIETVKDVEAESAETVSFTMTLNSLAEKYLVNPDNVFPSATLTMENFVSPDLVLEFGWAMDVDFGGSTYSTSNNVDFDVFISEATGFDISDPWSTWYYIGYMGATGNEPEVLTFSPGDLPDGDYVAWFDLWANGFWGLGLTDDVPVTVHAYQAGTALNYTFEQDPAGVINLDTPGYDDDGSSHNAILCRFSVSGSTWTVTQYDGSAASMFATSKAGSNPSRTPRPEASIVNKPKGSKTLK